MRLRRREYADKVNVRSMDALDAFIVQLRREAGSHDAGSQLWLLPHNSPLPEHRRTERTAAVGLPISEQELIDSLSTVPFSGSLAFNTVLGKFGLFGESGKCCGSRHSPLRNA